MHRKRIIFITASLALLLLMTLTSSILIHNNYKEPVEPIPVQDKSTIDQKSLNDQQKNNSKSFVATVTKGNFYQNNQSNDQILAIHPFGDRGIYLFRKQTNGVLYPEHKFFDGSIKEEGSTISITPDSDKHENNAFIFEYKNTDNKNTIVDTSQGVSYNRIKKPKVPIIADTDTASANENHSTTTLTVQGSDAYCIKDCHENPNNTDKSNENDDSNINDNHTTQSTTSFVDPVTHSDNLN